LIWLAPSNYELWVFFTLTLGDSYFPFLAYSYFPITLGAGVAIPVTKTIDIDARYRYFGTSNVTLSNKNGNFILHGNSFLVGLRVGL
jgi:hypothetical protein